MLSLSLSLSLALAHLLANSITCSHACWIGHSLSLSLTHTHSLSLDMLNSFCFHGYAQKCLSPALMYCLDSLNNFVFMSMLKSVRLSGCQAVRFDPWDMLRNFCFHVNTGVNIFHYSPIFIGV